MISEKRNLLTKILLKNLKYADTSSRLISNILEMPIPYLIIHELHELIINSKRNEFDFKKIFSNPVKFQSMIAIYDSVAKEFIIEKKENINFIKKTFLELFVRNEEEFTSQMLTLEQLFYFQVFDSNKEKIEQSFSDFIDYDNQPFGEVLKSLISEAAQEHQEYHSVIGKINEIYNFFEENKKV